MNFDPHKPCQTRSGLKARILATDLRGCYPICAAVMEESHPDGAEYIYQFDMLGNCSDWRGNMQLVNIPQRIKRTVWLNVYEDITTVTWTKPQGETPRRLACVKVDIDVEEGHGL